MTIKNNEATIYPIAGTFKRTGNDLLDAELTENLKKDAKENAEHVMLVDLARNDLGRHCDRVEVRSFKEIQYYSHLIHMVSKVTGQLQSDVDSYDVVGDTYPAGTLSGAPKYMAMQLIDRFEKQQRGFYSGAIDHYLDFSTADLQSLLKLSGVPIRISLIKSFTGSLVGSENYYIYTQHALNLLFFNKLIINYLRLFNFSF